MQPSPRAETSRLLFPSLRFCIVPPRQGNSLPQFPAEREIRRSDWRNIAISLIDPVSDPRPATSQLHPDLYPAHPPAAQRSSQLQREISTAAAAAAQHSSSSPAQLNTSQLSELSLFLQGRSKLSQFPLPVELPGVSIISPL